MPPCTFSSFFSFFSFMAEADDADGAANLVDALLCDDVLSHVIYTCLDVMWHAAAARVCIRWHAVLASMTSRCGAERDALIDQTVAAETRNGRTAPFVKRWAGRTRLLSARARVRFLHQGHLNGAAVGGYKRFEAWVRAQRLDCLPSAHAAEDDPYSTACPVCVRNASDIWAMARGGRVEEMRQSGEDLMAPECRHRAGAMFTVSIVCSADVDLLRRLYGQGFLATDLATWRAAARADRVDVLELAFFGRRRVPAL